MYALDIIGDTVLAQIHDLWLPLEHVRDTQKIADNRSN
jgi:hypothetical protein